LSKQLNKQIGLVTEILGGSSSKNDSAGLLARNNIPFWQKILDFLDEAKFHSQAQRRSTGDHQGFLSAMIFLNLKVVDLSISAKVLSAVPIHYGAVTEMFR
jgi:hypothetical protein